MPNSNVDYLQQNWFVKDLVVRSLQFGSVRR